MRLYTISLDRQKSDRAKFNLSLKTIVNTNRNTIFANIKEQN